MRQIFLGAMLAFLFLPLPDAYGRVDSLVLEGTYRGMYNDGVDRSERIGVALSLGIEIDHVLDVGVAFGNLFRDKEVIYDARARYFLTGYSSGLYLGGGYVFGDTLPYEYGYATLGYQFIWLYAELDMHKRGAASLLAVPEFGIRWRF